MEIGKKIDEVREKIKSGEMSGSAVADLGIKAIFAGLGSPEWEELMTLFKNNDAELDRLCGRDAAFMKKQWAKHCLAYIAGDSTCTSETAEQTGTKRSMRTDPARNMEALLDS